MKNSIIILALVFGFQTVKAQDFKATEKYIATDELTTKQQEYSFKLINIVASKDTSKKIATIEVEDLDFFEALRITILPNPNLENISEVIKVEVEYVACCANTETYYYLATNNGDYISLPSIENTYCDVPEASTHYIFPNQEYGQENSILTTAIHHTETYKIKDVEVLKKIIWNDNNFDSRYAITLN